MKKPVLFIDRDGTLILEPKDQQVDSFEKLVFYPEVIQYLSQIAQQLNFEIVMVTNQDGLGTDAFPEETFWPIQNFIIQTFKNEGVNFLNQHIDTTFAAQNAKTRKPNTGLLTQYFTDSYDLENAFVIGDRYTDVELAKNIGCKAILINHQTLGDTEISTSVQQLQPYIALQTQHWKSIYNFLKASDRQATITRTTSETDITMRLNLDGNGNSSIQTGIKFFDHMLEQIARHGQLDLDIAVTGDLDVDEHHTIEDTAITLGQLFAKALGNKMGIERYGFCLPMDDCLAQVAIDFGGRNWIEWDAIFKREMIGKMPTEMFFHFFKSFTDAAKCNLNIQATGVNEHHKIEAIFKAFAKAIKMAIHKNFDKQILPTTKGLL